MSPTSFKRSETTSQAIVLDELLAFLWRQWGQLGVAGAVSFQDGWIIDPEALLLFTLEIGRYDPRLFDEVLGWCLLNGDWLSIQRLKTLLAERGKNTTDILPRTLAAFAAVMVEQAPTNRWRTLLGAAEAVALSDTPQEFFRYPDGLALPVFGKPDPQFLQVGLLRAPFARRNYSMTPTIGIPATLLVELRALFGIDPRAETVAYLLTHRSAKGREIARAIGYSAAPVHNALTRLVQGGFVQRAGSRGYGLEHDRWHRFLSGGGTPALVWVDWLRVLPALADAALSLTDMTATASAYLHASHLLRQESRLCDALTASGLPNPFARLSPIETVAHDFPQRLLLLLQQMNDNRPDVRAPN